MSNIKLKVIYNYVRQPLDLQEIDILRAGNISSSLSSVAKLDDNCYFLYSFFMDQYGYSYYLVCERNLCKCFMILKIIKY